MEHRLLPIVTEMNYVNPHGRLVSNQAQLGPGSQEIVDSLDKQPVSVYDAGVWAPDATLDSHGFQFARRAFEFKDYLDDAEIESKLYPEVMDYLQHTTEAEFGLIFDHTVRSNAGHAGTTTRRAPVKTVHADYTDNSGPTRVAEELDKRGQLWRVEQPHVFVNLWMPIFHTVEESPLGVGDGRSFRPGDYHPVKLKLRDREGEIAGLSYHPQHRWYYKPNMSPGEVILIKVYDSDRNATVRWAPHSAFNDPFSVPGAKPRASIELRSILFFD